MKEAALHRLLREVSGPKVNPNIAYGDEKESPDFFESLAELESEPLPALFRAIYCIQRAQERDTILEYWERNVLVQSLVAKGLFMELAVALANDMVNADPDATNLRLLASALKKQGHAEDAARVLDRAAHAKDRHHEPAYLAFIERAKAHK